MGDARKKAQLKIHVKVPFIINDRLQIENLHKDIKIIQLPRLKSTRFCIITFEDFETKKRVVKHLQTLVFNNKKLRIKPWRKPKTPIKPKPQYQVLPVKTSQVVDERLSLLKKEEK